MVYFPGVEYRSHTSCMTEDQKYQGALYRPKQNKKQQQQQQQQQQQHHQQQQQQQNHHHQQQRQQQQQQQQKQPQQQQHHHQHRPAMNSRRLDMANTLALQPYVEDVGEDKEYESWHEFEIRSDDEKSPAGPLPEAPTPPSADSDDNVNVFDFLDNSQTPTASNLSRRRDRKGPDAGDSTSLVRYETKGGELLEPAPLMDQDGEPLVQYGTGPVPTGAFATPQPKTERRRSKDGDADKNKDKNKDKKRKRLHVDVAGDQIMADAPPVLHSGLTGGLRNMMRPAFPPSPDYSGDNIADLSPASPLKKTKHSRHHKSHHQHHLSSSIFGMIAGAPPKSKSRKHKSSSSKKHSHRHDKKEPKLIEFRPNSKDGKEEKLDGQMIVFKPRADVFLSFVNKGPESERGCSMNKALKRFHRERQAAGSSTPKGKEEKELWRSLRLRRNDRGEIVLFSE
ncbi:zinc finger domain-containing [Trichoderma cornu-damae]|uniref:Zinc finger domain-containing n=1 Tax=Trichoderma cornu-damae TaxID=654480 RepID=A0A9P8QJE8_9HYPO|nr:zinc finger domain-containing [Trichoderma cornu-damae]